jgi:sec-independent protein translocase protein TatA
MFRNPTTDLIVVLVIVLLIFGPKRLPGLGKQLGQGIREFKESITGDGKNSDEADEAENRPALTQAPVTSAPARPAADEVSSPADPAQPGRTERPSAEVGTEGRS